MKTFLQILEENADIDKAIEEEWMRQMRIAIHDEMERIDNLFLYGDENPSEERKREIDEWLNIVGNQ